MNNAPVKSLLDRNLYKQQQEIFVDLSDRLSSLVNLGTHVIESIQQGKRGREILTPVFLFRHLLTMTDGVEAMVRYGITDACIPLIRSIFEASLSIEYCINGNSRDRCLAYQVMGVLREIKTIDGITPGTQANKRWNKIVHNDSIMQSALQEDEVLSKASKRLPILEASLQKDPLGSIYEEWERVRIDSGRRPNWYTLYGGPNNIEGLAKALDRESEYEFLYREWSASSHGENVLTKMIVSPDHQVCTPPIRYPSNAKFVTQLTISLTIGSIADLMKKYCDVNSRSKFIQFYANHIRLGYGPNVGDSEIDIKINWDE